MFQNDIIHLKYLKFQQLKTIILKLFMSFYFFSDTNVQI